MHTILRCLPFDGVVDGLEFVPSMQSGAGVCPSVEPSGVDTAEAHDPLRLFKEGG